MRRPGTVSIVLAAWLGLLPAAGYAAKPVWLASWGEAMEAPPPPPSLLQDQTFRMIVHLSAGGDAVRVTLSNRYGVSPLHLGSVHIAQPAPGGGIMPGTDHVLTFGGTLAVTIPPGGARSSDMAPVPMRVAQDLAVSLYVVSGDQITRHTATFSTSYLAPGNQAAATALQDMTQRSDRVYLEGVDVRSRAGGQVVVAMGDSITDGNGTLPDTNQRWPDQLAALLAARGGAPLGVVNAGIAANELIGAHGFGTVAISRFDRDVLNRSGRSVLVLLEGINDCFGARAPSDTAAAVIAADRLIAARAHAAGMKAYGATLTPIGGTYFYPGPAEHARLIVNTFLRHNSVFDGVIDTDQALRDPKRPDYLLPAYDSGDHIHPGPAGMAAIARAVARVILP